MSPGLFAAVRVLRVLAPNPGPYTLDGTNTWIVGERPAFVIDPGPDDPDHISAVRREAEPIGGILLTHHHPDHAPGAPALSASTGAPVLAARAMGDERPLSDRMRIPVDGDALLAIATPGHSSDHMAFYLEGKSALFTGDAVLGRGTSIIDPPEGDLALYLRSLTAMLSLRPAILYPGHGPAVWDGVGKLKDYLDHRRQRELQVLQGLGEGPSTPGELVMRIYVGYPEELLGPAARSILAHLLKLEGEHRVKRVGRRGEERFELADPASCARCGRVAPSGATLCGTCSLAALQEAPTTGGIDSRPPAGRRPNQRQD